LAVLGDPIGQVQAPALLNPLLAQLGHDAVVIPVQVKERQLAEVIGGLRCVDNLDGMLITVPHKAAARRFADGCSAAASLADGTNAMRRDPDGTWFADNFDGAGFVAGLAGAGHTVAGMRISLVGAGGAGSAIAVALLTAGAAHLAIHDRDAARRDSLVARLERRWAGRVAALPSPGYDGVALAVNATPLGMDPDDPLPLQPWQLPLGCVVADIVMKPAQTPLLVAAAELGYRVHPGLPMLTSQLDLYRTFFRFPEKG
jgi:shikimate dehydrogenase